MVISYNEKKWNKVPTTLKMNKKQSIPMPFRNNTRAIFEVSGLSRLEHFTRRYGPGVSDFSAQDETV